MNYALIRDGIVQDVIAADASFVALIRSEWSRIELVLVVGFVNLPLLVRFLLFPLLVLVRFLLKLTLLSNFVLKRRLLVILFLIVFALM